MVKSENIIETYGEQLMVVKYGQMAVKYGQMAFKYVQMAVKTFIFSLLIFSILICADMQTTWEQLIFEKFLFKCNVLLNMR